jgi:hypothetical protein
MRFPTDCYRWVFLYRTDFYSIVYAIVTGDFRPAQDDWFILKIDRRRRAAPGTVLPDRPDPALWRGTETEGESGAVSLRFTAIPSHFPIALCCILTPSSSQFL